MRNSNESYKSLSTKKALELLKKGNSLTQAGNNLDTIRMNNDGTFNWKGIADREATILDESDLSMLFTTGKTWAINLFD